MPGFFQRAREFCKTIPYTSTQSNLNVQKLQAGLTLINNLLTNIENQTGTNITIRSAQLLALIHVLFRTDTSYSEKLFHSFQFGLLLSLLTFEIITAVKDEKCENSGETLKLWFCLSQNLVNQVYTGTNLFVWALGELGQRSQSGTSEYIAASQADTAPPVEPQPNHSVVV
ncbi:hypothetical protein ACFORL_11705 [Legionella dresdenensis]|uniref:Uncharacterized protein n=1 Tax=Legionella dresdenensis TaxID=450200 RepID=A0ABV8CHI7_9GAMM